MTWSCPVCDRNNTDEAKFCGNSAQQYDHLKRAWVCAVCGRGNRSDAKFCRGCGHSRNQRGQREQPLLDLGGEVEMELVLIPAGSFMMGSPYGEKDRNKDEGPQHKVRIAAPFYNGQVRGNAGAVAGCDGEHPVAFQG